MPSHSEGPGIWLSVWAFCRKVPLDSLFVWASSEGSGETARMRRTFADRIGDKYQIRLTRSTLSYAMKYPFFTVLIFFFFFFFFTFLIQYSEQVNSYICIVVLRLNVPVNNFSVISGRSHRFLGNKPVLSGSKVSCSRTQHGGGRSRTPDLSLRSPTLYHWATALPHIHVLCYDLSIKQINIYYKNLSPNRKSELTF